MPPLHDQSHEMPVIRRFFALIVLTLIQVSVAFANNLDAEKRLRWELQQPDSRGNVFAQGKLDGVDYRNLLRGALVYDRSALAGLFHYTTFGKLMGEGAETNCEVLRLLLDYWGDNRFASVLSRQPERVRTQVIAEIGYGWPHPGWQPSQFPKTYRLGPHK